MAAAEPLALEKETPSRSSDLIVERATAGAPEAALDPFVERLFGGGPSVPSDSAAGSLSVQRLKTPVLQRAQRLYGNRASQQIVMRASALQRQCKCGGTCTKCQEEEERRALQRSSAAEAPAEFDELPTTGGEPLSAATRHPLEAHFGADLADVRVHTGSEAADSASKLDALAYTSGRDIYFAPGMYAPASDSGRRLLAHEVAHVVQQGSGKEPSIATKSSRGVKIGAPDDILETEADQAAEAFISGTPLSDEEQRKKREAGSAVQRFIQRQDDGGAPAPAPAPSDATPAPASAPAAPSVAELRQHYEAALANARATGNWQDAAEKLNIFNHDDIQSYRAQLRDIEVSYLHQGALDNPGLGAGSQVAQLTAPGVPAASTPAPLVSTASTLDQDYTRALQASDWKTAAEKLNAFNTEDIKSRLVQLSSDQVANVHQGALDNPNLGPDSQVAQLTPAAPTSQTPASETPTSPAAAAPSDAQVRTQQLACVIRLGACPSSRDGGLPSTEEIQGYNRQCSVDSHYAGTDIYPTQEECANPPAEPLSTGEKILLGAFLVAAAAAGVVVIAVAGAEILPVAIVAIGEEATAGAAFYYANAFAVNQIGLFTVGVILSCEGNLPGLLKAIADDPVQAVPLLAEVLMLHVEISVQSGPPRRASVPAQLLPPEEQTGPTIKVRQVGPLQFEDESQNQGPGGTQPPIGPGQLPSGGAPKLPARTPTELLDFLSSQRGFGSNPPGIPEIDPEGIGTPQGKGYETYAAIQIADKDGNQVRVGIGAYLGGGQAHGERQAIAALRSGLPTDVDVSGGKMIVAVEKEPCPGCDGAIQEFAQELKLAEYEVYVPSRSSMIDPTKSVTAKQAARTVFQGGRPPTAPKQVP